MANTQTSQIPLEQQLIAKYSLEHNVSEEDMLSVLSLMDSGNEQQYSKYTHLPVAIEEFIESKQYLDKKGIVYPMVMEELIKINSGNYVEILLTGGIGAAKTTIALYTTAYQLYLLSLYKHPHREFELDPSHEILIVFQSITATLAKDVDYARFKDMIQQSRYFQRNFMFNRHIISELQFPNRIIVKPISGAETGAIGQNVIGGIIDEMNFMAIVEDSKNSIDGTVYDQAVSNYNSIAARRKSRFVDVGATPGLLCLVSSKRYPGQFTDTKEAEAHKEIEKTGSSTIYLYDKRVWDIKPWQFEDNPWFKIFIGDETHEPKILEEEDLPEFADNPNTMDIPELYRTEFENDMIRGLRDIAGVSTLARSPYLQQVSRVADSFDESRQSIVSRRTVDFKKTGLQIYLDRLEHKKCKRWVHVDLALTGDSAGLAMGYVHKFQKTKIGDDLWELMPIVTMDMTLEITPPKGGEINFQKIRTLLYKLFEQGVNITWISFDGYQSSDSMQQLRAKGFKTGYISLDKDIEAYETLKAAIYTGRFRTHPHKKLQKELVGLNYDATENSNRGKVDHPPTGSKDIADATAAVTHGLTTRKEIWLEAGIPLIQIPNRIRSQNVKVNEAETA